MTDKTAVEVMARGIAVAKARWTAGDYWQEDIAQTFERHPSIHLQAQAALDAYHEWLKAEGFCVVPVEPSGAQVGDMTKAMRDNGLFNDNYRIARCIYAAMIAAAQGGE